MKNMNTTTKQKTKYKRGEKPPHIIPDLLSCVKPE